jgi:hypothetical protein
MFSPSKPLRIESETTVIWFHYALRSSDGEYVAILNYTGPQPEAMSKNQWRYELLDCHLPIPFTASTRGDASQSFSAIRTTRS